MHVRDNTNKPNHEQNVHLNLDPTKITFTLTNDNKRIFEFDRKNIFQLNGKTLIANASKDLQ